MSKRNRNLRVVENLPETEVNETEVAETNEVAENRVVSFRYHFGAARLKALMKLREEDSEKFSEILRREEEFNGIRLIEKASRAGRNSATAGVSAVRFSTGVSAKFRHLGVTVSLTGSSFADTLECSDIVGVCAVRSSAADPTDYSAGPADVVYATVMIAKTIEAAYFVRDSVRRDSTVQGDGSLESIRADVAQRRAAAVALPDAEFAEYKAESTASGLKKRNFLADGTLLDDALASDSTTGE